MKQESLEPYKIFFETLSNEVRWKIIHLLVSNSYRSTDIADNLGYEQSHISHHLKRLERCGFVSVERNGKERIFTLNKKTILPLLEMADNHINNYCKKKLCCPTKNKKNLIN